MIRIYKTWLVKNQCYSLSDSFLANLYIRLCIMVSWFCHIAPLLMLILLTLCPRMISWAWWVKPLGLEVCKVTCYGLVFLGTGGSFTFWLQLLKGSGYKYWNYFMDHGVSEFLWMWSCRLHCGGILFFLQVASWDFMIIMFLKEPYRSF